MKENRSEGVDEILSFLDTHGVVDKDSSENATVKRKSRKRIQRFVLDLHGMKSEEAQVKIRAVFVDCKEKKIKELLIIHGKGYHSDPLEGPVLKKLVKDMLDRELRDDFKSFKTALPRDGGEGAVLICLK